MPTPSGKRRRVSGRPLRWGRISVGDPRVVVDHLRLGGLRLRVEDLVEVGQLEPAVADHHLAGRASWPSRATSAARPWPSCERYCSCGGRRWRSSSTSPRPCASALAFDALPSAPASSPLTAARLSSSAAIRSGALVGFGSSVGALTTSLPAAFALEQVEQLLAVLVPVARRGRSRWSATRSAAWPSRARASRASSAWPRRRPRRRGPAGELTSSWKRIVVSVSTSPIGRIAARCSLLRSTKRAIATLRASFIAFTSRA